MDEDKKVKITNLLTELSNLCSSIRNTEEVSKLIKYQHRTHQQSLGRFIQAAVKTFSQLEEEGYFDLRNEATCKMCSEVKDLVEDNAIPFI